MPVSDAVAFLSYVRADDEHERGRITWLRERLEGEVRMHTGRPFRIFQDNRDILWGQQWKRRLDDTLLSVTFLIPIITPGYFRSSACKDEFDKFLLREKQLGESRLILPIYYLSSDEIETSTEDSANEIAKVVASRNWSDWRGLRFKELISPEVGMAVSEMAGTIKGAMRELESIIAESKAPVPAPTDRPATRPEADIAKFTPEVPEIRGLAAAQRRKATQGGYYAYTKAFDEEIHAAALSTPEELLRLGKHLRVRCGRLRRQFNVELSAIEEELKQIDKPLVNNVTLLLDNSGSLRGPRVEFLASWAVILADLLDSHSVTTEILGFTTRAWKGGQAREQWLRDGKPKKPGRLNDLRHIVYKQFDDPAEICCETVSLMLRDGLFKENIDGEAILWAQERLHEPDTSASAILVVSDGAPVDDSTLQANSGNFLEQHLINTIAWVEKTSQTRLYGVGISHDVSRYYRNSLHVVKEERLGLQILEDWPNWLTV